MTWTKIKSTFNNKQTNELLELWDELDAADEWLRRGNTTIHNTWSLLISHVCTVYVNNIVVCCVLMPCCQLS